jgi:hypothetical protein
MQKDASSWLRPRPLPKAEGEQEQGSGSYECSIDHLTGSLQFFSSSAQDCACTPQRCMFSLATYPYSRGPALTSTSSSSLPFFHLSHLHTVLILVIVSPSPLITCHLSHDTLTSRTRCVGSHRQATAGCKRESESLSAHHDVVASHIDSFFLLPSS